MKKETVKKIIKKTLAITGILFAAMLLAMICIPYFFKDSINRKVKEVINENLNGGIDYTSLDLTFFNQFPILTATLNEVDLKGSAPYEKESLIKAEKFSLGIDLLSLFSDTIKIDGIYLEKAVIRIQVNQNGVANYNVYKSTDNSDASSSGLAIKRILISNSEVSYADASIPMEIHTTDFNYDGKGDLTKAVFDLKTKADIGSLTLKYDGETYVDHKAVNANLLTKINTDNLAFIFEKNDLKINKLPISFKGSFTFLNNGYDIDLKLKSEKSTLAHLLSLVPQSYYHWLDNTELKGNVALFASLQGKYIVEENQKPDFNLGLQIDNGLMAYNHTSIPLKNLILRFKINLPQLNFNLLKVDLQKMEFNLGDGYFKTQTNITGFDPFTVKSTTDCHLILDDLQKAIGWKGLTARGNFILKAAVEGTYATQLITSGLKNEKQISEIISVPTFLIESSLKGGYLKLDKMPKAIDVAEFDLTAVSKDHKVNNIDTKIQNIHLKSMSNYIKGFIHLKGLTSFDMDANAEAKINLGEIKEVYPLKDIEVRGNLFAEVITKGKLDIRKKIIPVINTTLKMNDGYLKTASSPIPLTDIKVEAYIKSERGSLKDLSVQIVPVSFKVNNQPFYLNADLKNFNDIRYKIVSKGTLELAPLYEIFSIEGVNVKGRVKTDFQLAGLQSDALNGRYHRLQNKGVIEVGNIQVKHTSFPKPFMITQGKFSFNNEKLNFNNFKARYGSNSFIAKGALDNIIAYVTTNQTVKGNFEINSNSLNVDDFTAFASTSASSAASPPKSNTGVVLLPSNVDLTLKSAVQKIIYNQIELKDFQGTVQLKDGKLNLTDTGFFVAGMDVKMNGSYKPINTKRALFDYAVKADNFDIQKAYHEIPLFREMLTSAKSAYGIVSLDYKLSGFLDKNMEPLLPSLEGEGILTLEDISFKGFKLLNSIAKETDRDKLIDSSVSKVVIRSSVKNNVLTIERTKTKMAGFRPRFEGKITLDGKLDLGMRLGLPPFGIIGIPFSVSGTQENPIIKMRRHAPTDTEMEEEMDEEDRALYLKQKEEEERIKLQNQSPQ